MSHLPRVTLWNEYRHERQGGRAAEIYPHGLHAPIAKHLEGLGCQVRSATIDEPEHGLNDHVMGETDVLLWWGHEAHDEVGDEVVRRVHQRVLDGMGFIALHSTHYSKIFKALLGTSCGLTWRSNGERERLWVVNPGHPIAKGVGEYVDVPAVETYGEPFDIPEPDALVFVSWFEGGEVFRSGCCFKRGRGNIFYFRPGDQDYPIYHQKEILQIIGNAALWAAPQDGIDRRPDRTTAMGRERPEPLERLGRRPRNSYT